MKPRPLAVYSSIPLVALLLFAPRAGAQCEFRFGPEQLARPLGGDVYAATIWDPDGAGPRPACLVVGGHFLGVAGEPYWSTAMYEDGEWDLPGAGLTGEVRALTVFNGDLIAGGTFLTAFGGPANLGRIARFNGTAWLPLGAGMDGPVNALTVLDGALYAAGEFFTAGGLPAVRVARWDGSSWSALGPGIHGAGDEPLAMARFGGVLVVGGDISMAGGLPMSNLAVWNGEEWSSPGVGVNDTVRALAVHDNGATLPTLVVGGDFTMAGGIPAQHVARRNSFGQWSAFGAGLQHPVAALHVRNSGLAGYIVTAALDSWLDSGEVWQFSGGVWNELGSFPGATPTCLVFHNFSYTVGSLGWEDIANVHAFDGAGWGPIGPGLSGAVSALHTLGPDLLFGGAFEYAHDVRVNHIARWNGTQWTAMDGGMNGPVEALIVSSNSLYAAGAFTMAGPVPTNNIARWNGAAWEAAGLPAAAPGPVWALAEFNGELIVGGGLDGGSLVRRLSGNTWVDMSAGFTPGLSGEVVTALAVWNGDLYAGANWPMVGSAPKSAIGRWDPGAQQWVKVQADPTAHLSHRVDRLLPFGGTLYAAGRILGSAPGLTFALASVGPSSFQALGGVAQASSAFPAWGNTLTAYEGALHVTGWFNQAGGQPANGFARLESAGWTPIVVPLFSPFPLGSNGTVPRNADAAYQGELVYGLVQFPFPEHRWARWHCPASCYPDCNTDGSLTVADFGCFQTKFVAGDPYADCNGDGVRTVADFGCFQTKFVAGCP